MSEEKLETRHQSDPTSWGQPVDDYRKHVLDTIAERQRAWAGNPAETRGASPLSETRLTGADVFWLAKRALVGPNGDPEKVGSDLHSKGGLNRWILLVSSLHVDRASLRDAYPEGTILSDVHLEGADLSEAHLEGAILLGANLEGADLSETHLEGADLSYAHLEGTNLRGSWLDGRTVLNEASFDHATKLGDIQWNGVGTVNLTQIAWEHVHMLGDERGVGLRSSVDDHADVVRAYRQLAAQLRAQGITDVADRFSYRAQIRQRYLYLRTVLEDWRRPWRLPGDLLRYFGSFSLALLAGYGYRPGRTIVLYFVFITLFAALYFAYGTGCHIAGLRDIALILAQQIPHSYACVTPPDQPMTWNEAFVVSFTAFHGRGFLATTVKPGDPQAALAAAEAVLGLIIEISFIATFTQRFFGTK